MLRLKTILGNVICLFCMPCFFLSVCLFVSTWCINKDQLSSQQHNRHGPLTDLHKTSVAVISPGSNNSRWRQRTWVYYARSSPWYACALNVPSLLSQCFSCCRWQWRPQVQKNYDISMLGKLDCQHSWNNYLYYLVTIPINIIKYCHVVIH